MPTLHDFLDAFDAAPTDVLRQAAASSVSSFFYWQHNRLRDEDPDTYSRAWRVLGWSTRTALGLGEPTPPPPAAEEAPLMVITITHREDRDRAGYAWRVQFHDRAIPELRGSAPTLAGVQEMLTFLLADPKRRRPAKKAKP
jgi:hypothetical protein